MHKVFVAESTDSVTAEVGDIVNVRYGNNLTFDDPIYIGPVISADGKTSSALGNSQNSNATSTYTNGFNITQNLQQVNQSIDQGIDKSTETIHSPINSGQLITKEIFKKIIPNAPLEDWHIQKFNEIFLKFSINTPARISGFLAQLSHESNQLRALEVTTKNRWNTLQPIESNELGSGYQGRNGNTKPGDGKRYIEKGYIQLVFRENYRRMSQLLRQKTEYKAIDLEANPELAKDRTISIYVAIMFFIDRNLFNLIDQDRFDDTTTRINGKGRLGARERIMYYRTGLSAFGFNPDTGRKS
jgi:putative chitinase